LNEVGEIVYDGGKQTAGNIEILVVKEVAQSYLTSLWTRDEFKKENQPANKSFVQLLSRYFTYIVFAIALATGLYWGINDNERLWPAVTAVFIIACPCALLLSNTFTNGNVLRILGRNHFYLRSAQTIEDIAGVDHIVLDKTGTLTSAQELAMRYEGKHLTTEQQQRIAALAANSNHPLSKAIVSWLGLTGKVKLEGFKETTGQGIEGLVGDDWI